MGNLVLVRHAATAASAAGRNLGQRSDPPLADAGRATAAMLAETLVAELGDLHADDVRLVTSPAQRCRQTMGPIAGRLGIASERIEVDDGLLEIDYGAWEGLTSEECRQRDPELRAAWEADPFATRCPDGESGGDVARRAFAMLEPLEAWVGEAPGRAAIVVAHNHVNRLRLCALFGWPMRAYRERLSQDPAGYSIVGCGAGAPVIRRVNASPA